jgi:hypothetical protein
VTTSSEAVEPCPTCGAMPCDQVNATRTPDPRLERLLAAVDFVIEHRTKASSLDGRLNLLVIARDVYKGGEA